MLTELCGSHAGSYCVNPATEQAIPIWVADYVLGSYGSGAIMAVPAHDPRDWAFAQAFKLPITQVVEPEAGEDPELPLAGEMCVSVCLRYTTDIISHELACQRLPCI